MLKILITIPLLVNMLLAESIKIESLGQIDSVIKHTEGKSFLDEQLDGKTFKSLFGTNLPSWITAKELSKLVAPKELVANSTLLGLKPWRKKDNTFVAIACYSDEKIEKEESPTCKGRVYLAILKNQKLIAKTIKAIEIEVTYENTQLIIPSESDEFSDPHTYVKFDFAPYEVKKDKFAFGLRVAWFSGFSGGGASLEALALFVQEEDEIVQIFAQPMYAFANLAGKWNDDGTREHHIEEEKNILIIQKRMTNGYYDLKVKSLDSKFSKIFVFDKKKNNYVARK